MNIFRWAHVKNKLDRRQASGAARAFVLAHPLIKLPMLSNVGAHVLGLTLYKAASIPFATRTAELEVSCTTNRREEEHTTRIPPAPGYCARPRKLKKK
jgi:hypothetical protein